ncbi:phosphatase 2C-like domain-containing protein [Zychaea mexicana]|uniref:phosphatase 2C-like domain-containing protein n=1 Tax=Zychaea mexicana TaxID=64656 RepID=UPI0022FE7D75|nr:phosphatase 2C-like domain-containing protein [Zychaea mexicana]KAI9489970.1 phosphatase 2C-like domain-containing protein [Zychaea mexicana]
MSQLQSGNGTTTNNNNGTGNGNTSITADGFSIGVAEDRNKRCRRTMEDAHSYITDYIGVPRQGFFAIFDGHAGKATADWCGANFHKTLAECLSVHEGKPIPEILNLAFLEVDRQVNLNEGKSSGCTAVVAFVQAKGDKVCLYIGCTIKRWGQRVKVGLSIGSWNEGRRGGFTERQTLYTGNVGDARAVLCRKGKAVRLSYDHKGSDHQEAKRITDLGGFMMNNRVNGVLAVTRSLGDCVMKEFVVGNPYTTETELGQGDDFLILACDGLWDVCEDQDAVDLVKDIQDPQAASRKLLDHALANFSTDNLSILVIRF